jgi:P-type Cu+ transporter
MPGEVHPQDKVALVANLQQKSRLVAMAGDGIQRCARPLSRANVGIAMGTGTDVAMGSVQVTLVKGTCAGSSAFRRARSATSASAAATSGLAR